MTNFNSSPSQRRFAETSPNAQHPYIYQVTPGDSFEGMLGLINTFPDTKEASLMLLMNYAQAEFQLDTGSFVYSTDLEMPRDKVFYFRFTTRPLSEGYYDLALVMVINPHNSGMDTLTRVRTTFTPVIRASIFVGDAALPVVQSEPFANVTPDPQGRHTDALFLTNQPDGFTYWPGATVSPGEKLNLFLRFSIPSYIVLPGRSIDSEVPVAFVGFMDDSVVPIDEEPTLYGKGKRGGVVTVPVSVVAPQHAGIHQFFIHRFPNPYTEVLSTEPLGGGFYSLSTQRVVLDVEP